MLKAARKKQLIINKEFSIRLSVDFSSETMEARRQWYDVFQVLKERKKSDSQKFYLVKLSFKDKRGVKIS